MSFYLAINGKPSGPLYTDRVKAVFAEAIRELRKIPNAQVIGAGYSNDKEGFVELSSDEVAS